MPGRPVTAQDEEQIRNLKITVFDYETDQVIETTPRLDAFARRWLRLYGTLPRHDHTFPNYWDTKFIVWFGPLPSADNRA